MFRQNNRLTILTPSTAYPYQDYHTVISVALSSRRKALDSALALLMLRSATLAQVAALLVDALNSGHKALVVGNGGSAAEAQHFAAELVGRFKRERLPYPVLSLTTDTATLTAVANDYGYEDVFARQLRAFGQPNDVLIAFSTSGESENILRAARVARERKLSIVAITGNRPCSLEELADIAVRTPVVDTALVQEMHMMITHILCDIVESELSAARVDEGTV